MNVPRYRAGDARFLVVDAEQYVPDRAAFAARHCDGQEGVAPPTADGAGVGADRPVPDDQPAITGGAGTGRPAAADRSAGETVATPGDAPGAAVRGADAALFLALEPDYRPPRVVLTVVRPDGERTPFCPDAARCAARWAARRTGADRVMVDTQAGTREARVHDDGTVGVETAATGEDVADDSTFARDQVVREFVTDVDARGRDD